MFNFQDSPLRADKAPPKLNIVPTTAQKLKEPEYSRDKSKNPAASAPSKGKK